MWRIACPAVVVAVVVAMPPVARADDDRRSVVVLGVIAKDRELAAAADAMTTVIRTRAGAKSGAYRVRGTREEVDQAITSADCSTNQVSCAVGLAAGLDGDYAIAGELDRRGGRRILVLSLVDVHKKERVRAVREIGGSKGDPKKLARSAYARLVDGETGALTVIANAQHGEVWIDGQIAAALFEGRATIDGLVNGTHQLSIRARGYRPFDLEVTIEYATKETVLLEPEPEP